MSNNVLSTFFTMIAAIAFYNVAEHWYYKTKWYFQSKQMRNHRREWTHFLATLEGTPSEKVEQVNRRIRDKSDELS